MRILQSLLLLVLLGLPALAWGEPVEMRYGEAAAAYHNLARNTDAQAAQWRQVAAAFYAIFGDHKRHPRGPDGLFSAALAGLATHRAGGEPGDLRVTLARFQQFLRIYPDHRLADDSLMHIGAIYARRPEDAQRAYLTYRQVLAAYPDGDQATLAGEKAAALEAKEAAQGPPAVAGKSQLGAAPRPPSHAATAQAPGPATVKRVLYSSLGTFTRVILTTDEMVDYKYSQLPPGKGKPPRFYIDLANTRPVAGLGPEFRVEDPLLNKIRISTNNGATRIVFDLTSLGRYEVKNLALPHEKKIIVDLFPGHPPNTAPVAPASVARLAPPSIPEPAPATLRNALGLKVKTLVIDPGHGGRDPGAMGFGTKEKHVALQLAKELKAVFEANRPDIRVELTRERDVFIALGRRPAIAKAKGADLFVSIHLNAHTQERFHGIETYFLNLTSDASALQVAARENLSTEKQIGDLNAILRDLLQDTNIVESSKLAGFLQASLITGLRTRYKVRNLGVKQAPFMVLIGAEMPGVLVEAGFLTNRRENKRLRSKRYLRRIAEGIYEGLQKYIQEQTYALDDPRPFRPKSDQDS